MSNDLPIAVIGGGPIGLAAAAHLISRGVPVRLFESGSRIASNLRAWRHVRLFSIWEQCLDEAAVALLKRSGWQGLPARTPPTGGDLIELYLEPLAATPELAAVIETDAQVLRITRQGLDRVTTHGREKRPFVISLRNQAGGLREFTARAVIDTSGTWNNPNPIGANGWPVPGEEEFADRIAYGIPDISGADRANYTGLRSLVLGGGHSAANALIDLAFLAEEEPHTTMTWAVRTNSLARVFGGGDADQLPARGRLGERLRSLVEQQRLDLIKSFAAQRLVKNGDGVLVEGRTESGERTIGPFDRIIVATGQRPDFSFARELQLDLHPVVESARALGPLIDPNIHSCGSVPPHGWRELAHPEPGYFVAGIKSYGRAPTFLLLTGYEQVRSIAAHLAGDDAAADDVRLALPETGVCSAALDEVNPGALCCDGAAPNAEEPCCERPIEARSSPCCATRKPQSSARVAAGRCC
jgi:thioredoxin reductase